MTAGVPSVPAVVAYGSFGSCVDPDRPSAGGTVVLREVTTTVTSTKTVTRVKVAAAHLADPPILSDPHITTSLHLSGVKMCVSEDVPEGALRRVTAAAAPIVTAAQPAVSQGRHVTFVSPPTAPNRPVAASRRSRSSSPPPSWLATLSATAATLAIRDARIAAQTEVEEAAYDETEVSNPPPNHRDCCCSVM